MPKRLSAVDAVSPAFSDAKRLLFQPFRFGLWSRFAWIGLLTGEFAGAGWGGSTNWNLPSSGGGSKLGLLFHYADPTKPWLTEFLPWILLGAAAIFVLGLVWIYAASVGRFILLDAVLNGRYRLREGWKRWREPGQHYFFWQLSFTFVMLLLLAIVVGVPVLLAWRAGWFRHGDEHFGWLVGGGILLFFVLMGLILLSAVVELVAKDFLVPVMALENRGVFEGWRRLGPMLLAEKWAYAGYILMKIVLAVGSAILFGILDFLVILFALIPLGIIGVAAYFLVKGAALSWNPVTISAVVLLAVAACAAIFWVMAFVYSPGLVFFQSYTLQFLGSRYPALETVMFPPPHFPPPSQPMRPNTPFPAG